MLFQELYTTANPYHHTRFTHIPLARHIIEGGLPAKLDGWRERGITDALWELLQSCWEAEPAKRLTAAAVCGKLESSSAKVRTTCLFLHERATSQRVAPIQALFVISTAAIQVLNLN